MNDIASLFDQIAAAETKAKPAVNLNADPRSYDGNYSTPAHYIDCIRAALSEIACDPASSDADNAIVKATVYYTHERGGLAAESWPSPFYLNPPSARRDEFLERAAREAAAGAEAVVCLNLKHLCTAYAKPLLRHVTAVHIPLGRPAFVHPATRERSESPTDGRAFLYCGRRPHRFVEAFGQDAGWTFLCYPYIATVGKVQAEISSS